MARAVPADDDSGSGDEVIVASPAPKRTPSHPQSAKPTLTPRSRARTIVEVEIHSPKKRRRSIHDVDGPVAGPSSPKQTPARSTNGAATSSNTTTKGVSAPTPLKSSSTPADTAPATQTKDPSPEPLFRIRAGRNKPNFTPRPKLATTSTSGSGSASSTPIYVPPTVPDTIPSPAEAVYEPLFTKRKGRTPAKLLKAHSGTPLVAKPDQAQPSDPEPLLPTRAGRTPLAKATNSNRGTPVPAASVDGKTKKGDKADEATPVTKSHTPAKGTPGSKRKSLAGSVSKALPAQSASARKRARVQPSAKEKAKKDKAKNAEPVFEFEDEYAAEPSPAAISRETFLANEKLRKQREARNFTFEGDANAPKLTRSGRVIGEVEMMVEPEVDAEPEDEDETEAEAEAEQEELEEEEQVEMEQAIARPAPESTGVMPRHQANSMKVDVRPEMMPVDEEEVLRDRTRRISPIPEPIARQIDPLSPGARILMLDVLGTLSGRGIAHDPPPFANEDKNEALSGVVHLLKGTVERGEGNSALLVGARGVGKSRTMARALRLLPSSSTSSPIVVRLSGFAQTNDRLAIREMGRQIAEAEGMNLAEDEDDETAEDAEYAPTTLPSHLLALLTKPSPRAIIIVMEEFDLFTEHARQALLYCLLDVVQSVKTGPVETTGRGVAVIGITSRVDTLLLLEKRVKSRFSHRMWRVQSPLSPEGMGWRELLGRALEPWKYDPKVRVNDDTFYWRGDWEFAIETLLKHDKVVRGMERLCGLTTDVRLVYRPLIQPISQILADKFDFVSVPLLCQAIIHQIENSSWGLATAKLKGLPHPAVGVLIIAKHLSYIGREEFTFAMVEEEYLKFARTKLVGSGRSRWPLTVLRSGYDHLLRCSLLVPSGTGSVKPRFAKVRCTLSPHEVVAWMKGDGAAGLGPEMVGWGRLMGGHL